MVFINEDVFVGGGTGGRWLLTEDNAGEYRAEVTSSAGIHLSLCSPRPLLAVATASHNCWRSWHLAQCTHVSHMSTHLPGILGTMSANFQNKTFEFKDEPLRMADYLCRHVDI